MRTKIVKRLTSRPAFRMQTCVDHQVNRAAPHRSRRIQFGRLVAVQAQRVAERSGVQTPAFRKGSLGAEAAESRQVARAPAEARFENARPASLAAENSLSRPPSSRPRRCRHKEWRAARPAGRHACSTTMSAGRGSHSRALNLEIRLRNLGKCRRQRSLNLDLQLLVGVHQSTRGNRRRLARLRRPEALDFGRANATDLVGRERAAGRSFDQKCVPLTAQRQFRQCRPRFAHAAGIPFARNHATRDWRAAISRQSRGLSPGSTGRAPDP